MLEENVCHNRRKETRKHDIQVVFTYMYYQHVHAHDLRQLLHQW